MAKWTKEEKEQMGKIRLDKPIECGILPPERPKIHNNKHDWINPTIKRDSCD
jgi:hypothetical protein